MLRSSERYSRGLAAALTRGYRQTTRAVGISPLGGSTSPASSPQHSFGNSACACATISSTNRRGSCRRNGVDKVVHPFDAKLYAKRRACVARRVEKGVRHLLCEAPSGPFRQKVPDPFLNLFSV